MKGYRVLSFGAGTGKLAYVFLVGGKLIDWRLSGTASQSAAAARQFAEHWIDELKPHVVVVEDIALSRHKGKPAKAAVAAIAAVAADRKIFVIAIPRPRNFPNKYLEAEALAERFPALKPWIPRPRQPWEGERREVAYFEALALALAATSPDGPFKANA